MRTLRVVCGGIRITQNYHNVDPVQGNYWILSGSYTIFLRIYLNIHLDLHR